MRRVAVIVAFAYGISFPIAFVWLIGRHPQTAMAVVDWVRHAGFAGIGAYIAAYAIGPVCMFPIVVMSTLGGFLFGPWLGLAVTSPANAIGATCAFVVGRLLLKRWLEPVIAGNPRIEAVDRAIGDRGIRLTLLLRLSPVLPHNMLNFAMATTRLRTHHFTIGTWIGAIPITTLQVVAGARARDLTEAMKGTSGFGLWSYVLTALGLAVTAVVVWIIARTANRELTRMMDAASSPPTLPRRN